MTRTMFGIKTYIKNKLYYPDFLFPKMKGFPEFSTSGLSIFARIYATELRLKNQKKHSGIENLITYPNKIAAFVWRKLLPYNPNNLGNWSIKGIVPNIETALIEKELIEKIVSLYRGQNENLEGYVTSGATESNIFSCWLARKYLEKKVPNGKICLIKTGLAHYSIAKSASIVGVESFETPLNDDTWSMDVENLRKTIKNLAKKGYKGFIIPLTLGYTVTGKSDAYISICNQISVLQKKSGLEFFVFIDAALNGFVEPFLNTKFSPFSHPIIQTFLTDFHKFGFVPYPAGLVLYRGRLRSLIEKPTGYLEENDNTLLGSRSGISAVACWAVIHKLGKSGFRDLVRSNLKEKGKFIKTLGQISPDIRIITDPNSLGLGIMFNGIEGGKLPVKVEKKYGLYQSRLSLLFLNGYKKICIYKFFFLEKTNNNKLKNFYHDLSKIYSKN